MLFSPSCIQIFKIRFFETQISKAFSWKSICTGLVLPVDGNVCNRDALIYPQRSGLENAELDACFTGLSQVFCFLKLNLTLL